MFLNQLHQLHHQSTPVRPGQSLPRGILEGLPGSPDGDIDILLAGRVDRGDFRLIPVSVS